MGAIVLAGGKSSRMGGDKALLPWGEGTLLEHVIDVMRHVTEAVVVVADVADKYTLPDGVRVIADEHPRSGPLGGLITGLKDLSEGVHLAVACDMPSLQPELLRFIQEAAAGFDTAVPSIGGRLQPLCAAYNFSSLGPLDEAYQSGTRSLLDALSWLHCRILDEQEVRPVDPTLASFVNWNTPEDLTRPGLS